MTRTLMTFVLAVALVGCERSKSSSKDFQSGIIPVQSNDREMNAAMQTARDRFPEFWREVSADYRRVIPVLGGSMVKVYFFDPDAPKSGEHMWIHDVDYDGKTLSGVLADTPLYVHSVRAGQKVSFPLERLSDWFYVEDGKAVGAFTVRILRGRMSESERRAHDSHYSFRFE